jgi:hypothetical protein
MGLKGIARFCRLLVCGCLTGTPRDDPPRAFRRKMCGKTEIWESPRSSVDPSREVLPTIKEEPEPHE